MLFLCELKSRFRLNSTVHIKKGFLNVGSAIIFRFENKNMQGVHNIEKSGKTGKSFSIQGKIREFHIIKANIMETYGNFILSGKNKGISKTDFVNNYSFLNVDLSLFSLKDEINLSVSND